MKVSARETAYQYSIEDVLEKSPTAVVLATRQS